MNGSPHPGDPVESAIREEAERTRADLSGRLGQAERALLPLAAGGLVALFGVQLLAAAGVLLLGRVMQPWIAATILGASALVVGALIMAAATRRALSSRPPMERPREESRDRSRAA